MWQKCIIKENRGREAGRKLLILLQKLPVWLGRSCWRALNILLHAKALWLHFGADQNPPVSSSCSHICSIHDHCTWVKYCLNHETVLQRAASLILFHLGHCSLFNPSSKWSLSILILWKETFRSLIFFPFWHRSAHWHPTSTCFFFPFFSDNKQENHKLHQQAVLSSGKPRHWVSAHKSHAPAFSTHKPPCSSLQKIIKLGRLKINWLGWWYLGMHVGIARGERVLI